MSTGHSAHDVRHVSARMPRLRPQREEPEGNATMSESSQADTGEVPDSAGKPGESYDNQRRHPRVRGPFDGLRVGFIDTPVRIYDLSEGGCFLQSMSMSSSEVGTTFDLRIELPDAGWVAARAAIVYSRADYGSGVRFVDMSDPDRVRLKHTLELLREAAPR